jgi:hypothetical protein
MRTYPLTDGDTLTVSVDGGAWETITFAAGDFGDVAAATAEELAAVLNRSGSLAARADDDGNLVLATASSGGNASLEIDAGRSTAAPALGLSTGQPAAYGAGLQAARLVSLAAAPFPLPKDAELYLVVDGRRRRVSFDKDITANAATADEVVAAINRARKIARVARDDRVMLTSPTIGPESSLEIVPGRVDEGHPDAAVVLGFVGGNAFSQPHTAEPATLVCGGQQTGLVVVNLTAAPIELYLAEGPTVLPARGALPIAPGDAGHDALQRLIDQGAVRLMSAQPA